MAVVGGSAQLAALGARLKLAGARGLRLELTRGIRAAAVPLIADVRAAALAQLPKSGGLAERVASSPIKVQTRLGARTAGVRIVTTQKDTRRINDGTVRHPVFGHMDRWSTQDIPGATGWFSNTLASKGDAVTAEITAVMAKVSVQIQGGL